MRAAVEWQSFPWGSDHYFAHGRMMPEDALDRLRPFDAILFGAVGDPRLQDNVTLNGLLLPIRRGFDQYACVRPAVLYPGVRSPLAGRQSGDIDFVVVRENTEGEYAQIGGLLYQGGPQEVAMQAAMFTRHGTERVIRFAFDLARRRGRKRLLTSITKSNAQGFSMAFWEMVREDAPFRFTSEYASEVVRRFFLGRATHGDAVKYANMPARWTILQRINVGLVAILGRLQAENNWRRIAEEMWPITNAAPATPLGKEEAIWWAQRQALRP